MDPVNHMSLPEYRKLTGQMTVDDIKADLKANPSKADAQAEKVLQSHCERELHRRHIAYLHLSPRAREKRGWPDLTFVIKGRPIAVELKSAMGRLSADQKECLSVMRENGWEVYVMRDIVEFVGLFKRGEDISD